MLCVTLFPWAKTVVDFYNDHYGWLDQVDKDFYNVCNPTNNKTWEKTYGVSLVILMVRNVWALYEERQEVQKKKRTTPVKDCKKQKRWDRLIHFIENVCIQVGSFKK